MSGGRDGGEIEILRAPAGATVQDAGRAGKLSWGLPPSGPLDPAPFTAAQAAVGNPPAFAAIEVPLGAMAVRARGSRLLVSIDGAPARRLEPGEALEVPPVERAVRYIAVAGGLELPIVLGARATLLAAGIGGLEGRALRAGDVIPVGAAPGAPAGPTPVPAVEDPADPAVLHVMAGPHARRFEDNALSVLLDTTWRVSRVGDRVGVRLEGGRIPRRAAAAGDRAGPAPMVRGAMQITSDGVPIVLGPDHPVTGGYPVLAVLGRAAQALLARLRPGRALRFALVE